MRLTVLLPTLNEHRGLRRTVAALPRTDLERAGYQVGVTVVDAQSTDGTQDEARRLGARLIVEPRPGYGRAYKTGLASVKDGLAVTADADGTYPLPLLPGLLRAFRDRDLDFLTVNRFADMPPQAMRIMHRFGNHVLTSSLRMRHRIRLSDSQSGMWILSERARRALPLSRLSDGMPFSQEIKICAFKDPDLRSAEMPGSYDLRVGDAKLSSWRDGMANLGALMRFKIPDGNGAS